MEEVTSTLSFALRNSIQRAKTMYAMLSKLSILKARRLEDSDLGNKDHADNKSPQDPIGYSQLTDTTSSVPSGFISTAPWMRIPEGSFG
jgi:hypothetical protein